MDLFFSKALTSQSHIAIDKNPFRRRLFETGVNEPRLVCSYASTDFERFHQIIVGSRARVKQYNECNESRSTANHSV